MILLDTSVLSQVFRRKKIGPLEQQTRGVVEGLIAGEESLGLPGVVLLELLSGVRLARQFEELENRLLSSFTIVLPTVTDHVEAARLRNKCLAKGISASGIDCLIAVQAIGGEHELFTTDHDFRAIARIAPLKLFVSGHNA